VRRTPTTPSRYGHDHAASASFTALGDQEVAAALAEETARNHSKKEKEGRVQTPGTLRRALISEKRLSLIAKDSRARGALSNMSEILNQSAIDPESNQDVEMARLNSLLLFSRLHLLKLERIFHTLLVEKILPNKINQVEPKRAKMKTREKIAMKKKRNPREPEEEKGNRLCFFFFFTVVRPSFSKTYFVFFVLFF